jgi:hypothetical protein
MKKTLVYISGPYRGRVKHNIARARKIAIELWEAGYAVICPHLNTAHFEKDAKVDILDYLAADCRMIEGCDAVLMIPGWERSEGAAVEWGHAHKVNVPVYYYPMLPIKVEEIKAESVLQEADRLTEGDRNRDYGHPLDDFTRQAEYYTVTLRDLLRPGVSIPWSRIPLLMNCTKMAREINLPKRDNRVDGPGYWKTLDMGHAEEARRNSLTTIS